MAIQNILIGCMCKIILDRQSATIKLFFIILDKGYNVYVYTRKPPTTILEKYLERQIYYHGK